MSVVPRSEMGNALALRVLRKQVDLLYDNQPFAILITCAVTTVLFVYLSNMVNWDVLELWVFLFVCSIALRFGLGWLYFSARKNRTIKLKRAEIFYLTGVVFSGVFWAAMTLSLFPILNFNGQVLLLVVVTGLATGAHATMGYLRAPALSFMLLLFLPIIFIIKNSGFPGGNDIVVAVFLYLIFILRSVFMFYNNNLNMLILQESSIDRENELLLQREKANSANVAKSIFLSRMSHELRTPLNAILGFSELQLRDKKSPLTIKQSLRTQKIADAGKHLLSIVNEVLDFSRIETGSIEINLEVTDLAGIIQNSIKLVEGKAASRNVVLSAEATSSKVCVMADNNRLKQILLNLLDNAIKYNKPGGLVLVKVNVLENRRARLSVVDTGYGLQNEDLGDLFIPFSRIGAKENGIDGTGIGLSLCKELVELMGGNIGIDNNADEGCCFWIELPYVEQENNVERKTLPQPLEARVAGKVKVLLVEDNLVNSEVAGDMLSAIGVGVDTAHNGQEALEMCDKNQYALIFMDCEMPVLDGFSTTKILREKERERDHLPVPIIALTAHAISGAKEKCLASGMNDFISKPFNMLDLRTILDQWLELDIVDMLEQKVSPVGGELNANDTYDFKCDSNILDCGVLSKLYEKQRKSHSNLASKLIGIYLAQSSGLLDELAQSCQKFDVESVRKVAHTLKSSSVNVGALKLSELCRSMEQGCEKGIIEDTLVQQVYKSYRSVEIALIEVRDSIDKL